MLSSQLCRLQDCPKWKEFSRGFEGYSWLILTFSHSLLTGIQYTTFMLNVWEAGGCGWRPIEVSKHWQWERTQIVRVALGLMNLVGWWEERQLGITKHLSDSFLWGESLWFSQQLLDSYCFLRSDPRTVCQTHLSISLFKEEQRQEKAPCCSNTAISTTVDILAS